MSDKADLLGDLKAKLAALGCDEAKVTVVLEEASKLGVNDAETAAELTAEDWTRCGLLLAPARKLVRQLTAPAPEEPVAAAAAAAVPTALKPLPDDTSFLKMLVVGGVPKMKAEDAVAAVRVAIAERLGVFELEETILTRIEERAVSLRAQVPPVFYAIEDSKTRKTHPEILRAMGVRGNFVTKTRKKVFLARMPDFWASLASFQGRLEAWLQNWAQKAGNPGMMMTGLMLRGGDSALTGYLMKAPETTPLVTAARGVIEELNKIFAGTGIPVARALAADAIELRELLATPGLDAAVGAGSMEEAVQVLGIALSPEMADVERALATYALNVFSLPDTDPGQLTHFLVELNEVGSMIPWDRVRSGQFTVEQPNGGSFPPQRRTVSGRAVHETT